MAEKLSIPFQPRGRAGLTKKKAAEVKTSASKPGRKRPKPYSVTPDLVLCDNSSLSEFIDRCLENIKLSRRRMRNDQIEIDRLREETRALISDLMIA
jgi:hypothetical protein